MTLRSRLAALERAARRRQERGYSMTPVIPELKFDMNDPEVRAVFAELAELAELRGGQPVRDFTRSGGGPIQRIQAEIGVARLMLADPDTAEAWIALIDRALDAHRTGSTNR